MMLAAVVHERFMYVGGYVGSLPATNLKFLVVADLFNKADSNNMLLHVSNPNYPPYLKPTPPPLPLHMLRTSSHRLVAEELAVAELEVAAGLDVVVMGPLEDLVEIRARSDVRTATRRATLLPRATSFTQSKLLAPYGRQNAYSYYVGSTRCRSIR